MMIPRVVPRNLRQARFLKQALQQFDRPRVMSTMSVWTGQQYHEMKEITSTLTYLEKKDFSTAVVTKDEIDNDEHLKALLLAFHSAASTTAENVEARVTASAQEMDLVEAAAAVKDVNKYDKVLILLRHGEAAHNIFEREWVESGKDPEDAALCEDYPRDPLLTAKGIGQVLNLSRRTANFCTDETGLLPELFVVSPLRRATQTAFLTFPQFVPGSIRDVPWICHSGLMERPNGNPSDFVSSADELEQFFPGVDFSLYKENVDPEEFNTLERVSMVESKMDLLERTNQFLEWIKGRNERIILVSSHSNWLQSFCGFTLRYEPEGAGSEMFKTGEMRAVGIKFD